MLVVIDCSCRINCWRYISIIVDVVHVGGLWSRWITCSDGCCSDSLSTGCFWICGIVVFVVEYVKVAGVKAHTFIINTGTCICGCCSTISSSGWCTYIVVMVLVAVCVVVVAVMVYVVVMKV